MQRAHAVPTGLASLLLAAGAFAAEPVDQAKSWQKQANDTRAQVVSVAEELEQIGDQGNADAAGLIADAVQFLAQGDESRAAGDEKMAAEDFRAASQAYNMAWQYYVKAATAGLNARRMLTGK